MNKEEHREQFSESILEQYKLYVEMADRVSSRRAQTNRFYISLLSILLALLSIVISREVFSDILKVVVMAIGILGVVLCALWYTNIRSYRQLNAGKFQVIHEMEQHLPIAAYAKEWEILGRGKESRKYLQLTRVEQWVPFVLMIPYLLLFAYSLKIWICGG